MKAEHMIDYLYIMAQSYFLIEQHMIGCPFHWTIFDLAMILFFDIVTHDNQYRQLSMTIDSSSTILTCTKCGNYHNLLN